jgi:hypothetical protein
MRRHHPRTTLARRLVADGAIGVDLRMAATLRLPGDVLAQFDVGLTHPDHDVYRIELDTLSTAIAEGDQPSFGRTDAVARATVLEALRRSAELATPVDLTPGGSGREWPRIRSPARGPGAARKLQRRKDDGQVPGGLAWDRDEPRLGGMLVLAVATTGPAEDPPRHPRST